jgi:hypothetical protein
MAKKRNKKPGPMPNHLTLEGDWQSAISKALKKTKPAEGWPGKGKKKS